MRIFVFTLQRHARKYELALESKAKFYLEYTLTVVTRVDGDHLVTPEVQSMRHL